MTVWEIASVDETDKKKLDDLLANGWQPFSVVVDTSRSVVWLRRVKPKDAS